MLVLSAIASVLFVIALGAGIAASHPARPAEIITRVECVESQGVRVFRAVDHVRISKRGRIQFHTAEGPEDTTGDCVVFPER